MASSAFLSIKDRQTQVTGTVALLLLVSSLLASGLEGPASPSAPRSAVCWRTLHKEHFHGEASLTSRPRECHPASVAPLHPRPHVLMPQATASPLCFLESGTALFFSK